MGVDLSIKIKKCNLSLVFLLVLISLAPSANCSTLSSNNKLEIMPNRNNDIHNLPINKRKFFSISSVIARALVFHCIFLIFFQWKLFSNWFICFSLICIIFLVEKVHSQQFFLLVIYLFMKTCQSWKIFVSKDEEAISRFEMKSV